MAVGIVMPAPIFTGWDNNGNPLVGGKLYAYLAGTTTATNTYSDVGLATPNTNPVILDAAGRAVIYLDPTISYKFVLTDSADAAVWTRDNIREVSMSSGTLDVLGTAGVNLSNGEAAYLSDGSGGLTAGRWYKATATYAYASVGAIVGFATAAIAAGDAGTIRLSGVVDGLSSLTPGATYYVAVTSGEVTASPSGVYVRPVGVAASATSLVASTICDAPVCIAASATYAVDPADGPNVYIAANGTFTVSLYTAVGHQNNRVTIKNVGAGVITVDGDGAETIDGAATLTLAYQYSSVTLISNGTLWHVVARSEPDTYVSDLAATEVAAKVRVYTPTLVSVENSSVQTTFLSFTLPANSMADGDYVVMTVAALIKNNAGAPKTALFAGLVGANYTTLYTPTWADSATEYQAMYRFTFMRVGSVLWYNVPGYAGGAWIPLDASYAGAALGVSYGVASGAVDFTVANTVGVGVTLASAHANLYLKPQSASVLHVKGS